MKHRFLVLFLLLYYLGSSQTTIPIVGFKGTINTFPTVSGDTITATITLLDISNQFTGNNLIGRDSLVLWRNCKRYRVDTVLTAFATQITVKLLKEGNQNITPGVVAFIEETKANKSFAPAGITDGERQCINAYYVGSDSISVDSIYLQGDSLILLKNGSGQVYKARIYNQTVTGLYYDDIPNPQKGDFWIPYQFDAENNRYYDGSDWVVFDWDGIQGNEGLLSLRNYIDKWNTVGIHSTGPGFGSTVSVKGDTLIRVSYDEIAPILRLNFDTTQLNTRINNFISDSLDGFSGETQYLNPYVIGLDTVGAWLTVALDTLLFVPTEDTTLYCCPPYIGNDTLYIGDNYVVLPSGEATTVGDTPTINMTLTGVNITGEVIDGSITPAKLDRTYLETEVDGSVINEIELPSQTGNSGKYLSTNGTSPSWETVSGGGLPDYALLDHGSTAGNTQTLTLNTWNTLTFSGAQESDSGVINADASTEEIDFVVAGTYRIEYFATWISNVSSYTTAGIYSDNGAAQLTKSQVQVRTQTGFLSTTVSKVFYHTAIAGETIKFNIYPDATHTSVGIYSYLIATKVN